MPPFKGYEPVDLSEYKEFNPLKFKSLFSVIIPSQGADIDEILNKEGEMAYEQRQYSMGIGNFSSLFITRRPFPSAEKQYWNSVFSDTAVKIPEEFSLTFKHSYLNLPLDRILLSEPEILENIAKRVQKLKQKHPDYELTLQSFNQTKYIEEIASKLGVKYYGNSRFAEWAGTKTGLVEFADECNVPTPLTFKVDDFASIYGYIEGLAEAGYDEMVIKLDHSTGGMGHKRISLGSALKAAEQGYYERILPNEYISLDKVILQGWIPNAISISLAIFVNFDGTYEFTGAQVHELKKGNSFSAIGAYPMSKHLLPKLLDYGHRIAKGYVKHKAYGPHTVGFIVPESKWLEFVGMEKGEIFVNDENSRPGASTIALNWLLPIREGIYGKGWRVSKVPVKNGATIQKVISVLESEGLLINRVGKDVTGVFVYGGLMLDSGYEKNFYAIALSGKDDYYEAEQIMERVKSLFR